MFFSALKALLMSVPLLQAANGVQLDEAGGPQLLPRKDPIEISVVIFEIQIGADGSVVADDLIQGRPEYVERSRLALKDWRFSGVDPKLVPIPASVVFLYRPRPDLPDASVTFDQPLPAGFDENYFSP